MTTRRNRDAAPATVPAPVAGAGRVFQQGGALFAVMELLAAFGVLHLDGRQYAAVIAFGTPVVGFVQELIENRFGKAWLRSMPDEPSQVPVVADDSGHVTLVDLAIVCGVLAICVVLVLIKASVR